MIVSVRDVHCSIVTQISINNVHGNKSTFATDTRHQIDEYYNGCVTYPVIITDSLDEVYLSKLSVFH